MRFTPLKQAFCMKNRYIGEPMNLLNLEEKLKQGIFALALPGFLKMNRPERQPGSRATARKPSSLPVYQYRQLFFCKFLVGNLQQIIGSESIDALVDLRFVLVGTVMQEALAHVEGYILEVIG